MDTRALSSTTPGVKTDRRARRTQAAVRGAFTDLLFARGLDAIAVRDIAEKADIARSTFYLHFTGKEDVLRACMSPFLDVFASCTTAPTRPSTLEAVLSHMAERRRVSDAIFSGNARSVLSRALAAAIESALGDATAVTAPSMPLRLIAASVAEMQLALLEGWLRGRGHAKPDQVADAMYAASRAASAAYCRGPETAPASKPATVAGL